MNNGNESGDNRDWRRRSCWRYSSGARGRVLPGEDGQDPGEGEEKRREIPGGKGVRKQREIHGAEGLKAFLPFWNVFWLPAAKNPFKKAAPCDKIGRKTTGRIFEDENSSNL